MFLELITIDEEAADLFIILLCVSIIAIISIIGYIGYKIIKAICNKRKESFSPHKRRLFF